MAVPAAEADLDQIMAVTAADRERAAALLAAAGGSVQRAINIHFEAERVPEPAANGADASPASPAAGDAGDEVRAPIPPRAEVLLEPAHSAANYALPARRSRLRQRDSVFDKFRDFSAEIRLQERQLGLAAAGPSRRPVRDKLQTLEEIFRPPLELIFRGTFQAARDQGVADRKWLMVNVQNTEEFACQVLNRDVWSSHKVRDIVRANFVFWQVYHESSEGLKYKTFYPVSSWPYVAILDPRTGELLRTWGKLDKNAAIELLIDFLEAHKFSEDAPPTPKRPRQASVLELDEEAQLRLAIEKSLRPEPARRRRLLVADSDSDGEDDDFWAESPALSSIASTPLSPGGRSERVSPVPPPPRQKLEPPAPDTNGADSVDLVPDNDAGKTGDDCARRPPPLTAASARPPTPNGSECGDGGATPAWTLALRLPDGTRVQLQLPASARLRCVTEHVQQLGYPAAEHVLLATFPRRVLSAPERAEQTLREAGLHSHDTVFVQSR
ncbi:UBX domain-containing protein 7-like [Pollicipes pollicipes]|uniref:UBX domain-containing protein 7-like n=1 Tax=Pollicipes pollicipes TaxID=41117 RepID=UPI00188497E2|nr:UBX domain-containing protein 7-like [Pollicipes pollicipes]XP_037091715.1 UBX domain-containing protein 7-like [Pollicipes pollicipes]